ncbi:MAG: hypothetical protein AAF466_06415, partial [Bacteroidota bacterium]
GLVHVTRYASSSDFGTVVNPMMVEDKMRYTKIFAFVFLLNSFGCTSQTQESRIEIIQPSVQQEATSIWRTINDIAFFEGQGYTIHLPKDPVIDSLITKSKSGTFGNNDFPTIYTLLESKVYDPKSYEIATQKVEEQLDLLNDLIGDIDNGKSKWDWKFNMFLKYRVVFTLYGTGGSYDPDEGIITLLTTEQGGFMNYTNPANTIIHEITHMGMEYSIVRPYQLTHGSKERFVDTFVFLMFHEQLPEYRIQNMGDKAIDDYLKKKEDIGSINAIASKFANK